MAFSKQDLQVLEDMIRGVTEPQLFALQENMDSKFAILQSSVDGFVHETRRNSENQLVLHAQFTRLKNVLMNKHIVSEDELAL